MPGKSPGFFVLETFRHFLLKNTQSKKADLSMLIGAHTNKTFNISKTAKN